RVPRGSLLPPQRHPRAAAAAPRAPRGRSAPRAALPAEAGRRAGPAAQHHDVAGGAAAADGVRLARQRPAARKRRRARDGVQPGARADRRHRARRRDPERAVGGRRGLAMVSRRGARRRALYRGRGTHAHQAIARAHARQQGAGGASAEPEADDAHREAETAGAVMPPRFTYWTIIFGGQPTSFRSATRDELVPTFKQIPARHPHAQLRYFAPGRLWYSEEEAQAALIRDRFEKRQRSRPPGRWRPGAGSRERGAGSWKPAAESRKPEAGSWKPEAGNRKPQADGRRGPARRPRSQDKEPRRRLNGPRGGQRAQIKSAPRLPKPAAGRSHPAAGRRRPAAGSWKPEAGGWKRKPGAGRRPPPFKKKKDEE